MGKPAEGMEKPEMEGEGMEKPEKEGMEMGEDMEKPEKSNADEAERDCDFDFDMEDVEGFLHEHEDAIMQEAEEMGFTEDDVEHVMSELESFENPEDLKEAVTEMWDELPENIKDLLK